MASRENLAMRAAQEPMVVPNGSPKVTNHRPLSLKVESHDIGYSSESHSNEETDSSRYYSNEINGNVIENTPPPTADVGNVKLRVPGSNPPDSTWRYSMTSAYDTSSNCSDQNNSPDDHETGRGNHGNHQDCRVPGKVQSLLSSPSHSFYRMTTIETDSETTSATERPDCRSGAESLDLSYDDMPADLSPEGATGRSTARQRLDAVFENIEPLETPIGSPDDPCQVVPRGGDDLSQVVPRGGGVSDEDQSMDEAYGLAMSDSGESNALFDMESFGRSKARAPGSPCVQSDGEENSEGLVTVRDCIGRLLQQAKLLARDSQYQTHQPAGSYDNENAGRNLNKKKKHRSKKTARRYLAHDQSLTSTDGSALVTSDSGPGARSTCEASCEGTSGSSESDSEFSSTSGSEAEYQATSSTRSDSKSLDNTLCASASPSQSQLTGSSSALEGRSLLLRRTRGKTKLCGTSSDDCLDNVRYSVSESAINDLQGGHRSHEVEPLMRRTTSDLPRYTSPQQHSKSRRIRRSHLRKAESEDMFGSPRSSPAKMTYSQSLPSSRRHSVRSQSRSLSPTTLLLVQSMTGPDDTTHTDLTHSVSEQGLSAHSRSISVPEVGRSAAHDTDDEGLQQSLTSAAEFSENAWDNLVNYLNICNIIY